MEKMLILTDEKQVLCVYPYRDSDQTKITLLTQKAVIIGYGAPRIDQEQLKAAVERTLEYIRCISGGEIETIKVFGRFP
jgi:DNA/RNA-binding domain of Phe-tRNA-synthetase-like protein